MFLSDRILQVFCRIGSDLIFLVSRRIIRIIRMILRYMKSNSVQFFWNTRYKSVLSSFDIYISKKRFELFGVLESLDVYFSNSYVRELDI